jgi:glycosyltransferase involved in cell wall biosynthesis
MTTNQFFYPFEILNLLLKKKTCIGHKTILHIHWIEFLYRWGNHKYLVPFLVPSIITFFRIFKKISKNKVAVTVHNVLPHNVYWPRIEYSFFKIMLHEISDCMFVHSTLQKELIVKFYGVDSKKVHVIQHGLFKNPKLRDPLKNRQNRAMLGISQADVVFSFIGAISEYKGVSVLLDAMKELFNKQNNANIKLILAGESNKTYLNYLLRNYRDVLNDKRVLFLNKRLSEAELDNVLSIADFGICPYINATTPATLLDFICYNLPIITTNDSNVLALITDYPLIIAKKGDYLSLSHEITLAYNDVTKQEEKAKFLEKMSTLTNAWRVSADLTLESYSNLGEIWP